MKFNKTSLLVVAAITVSLIVVGVVVYVKRKKAKNNNGGESGGSMDSSGSLSDSLPNLSTTSSVSVGTDNVPVLQKGMKGRNVAKLQAILNNKYNAGLSVDGSYGSGTVAAVKKYIGSNSLYPSTDNGNKITVSTMNAILSSCTLGQKANVLNVYNDFAKKFKYQSGV